MCTPCVPGAGLGAEWDAGKQTVGLDSVWLGGGKEAHPKQLAMQGRRGRACLTWKNAWDASWCI